MPTARLLSGFIAAALLAACGTAPTPAAKGVAGLAPRAAARPPVQSAGQLDDFVRHYAEWSYTCFDLNHDDTISEAEAQTGKFNAVVYEDMDSNHNAVVSHEEFARWWAVNVVVSVSKYRALLADFFKVYDKDQNGFVTQAELGIAPASPPAPAAPPVFIRKDNAWILVVKCFDAADFVASDETGDGKLVPSEYEDFWVRIMKRAMAIK